MHEKYLGTYLLNLEERKSARSSYILRPWTILFDIGVKASDVWIGMGLDRVLDSPFMPIEIVT